MINSLYIHIPFCNHICSYCDFCKFIYNEKLAREYINELIKEIRSYNLSKMSTIYIGGGTPSSLNEDLLEVLLKELNPFLKENTEFTIECNFESTNESKLKLFKKYGVNRLSFGVQSTNDEILKKLNRYHTKSDVVKTIKIAKDIGFNNINIDLIYGLPDTNKKMLEEDLNEFIKLDIEHISTYSLTVSPNTIFFNKGIQEVDDNESRELYDLIYNFLNEHGYYRYEVSNFSKIGYESKHNQTYWDNKEYVGVGLGASGYIKNIRYQNTKSLNEYLKGNYRFSDEEVSHIDNINYFLMLKLRKEKGFMLNELQEICSLDEYNKILDSFNKFVKNGLIILDNKCIKCSCEGLMLLDTILRDIFL